jgi:hypothetical protein
MAQTRPSKQTKPQAHTGEQHPEEYRHDLNPNANAGQNLGSRAGVVGAHAEKDGRTAYDIKELHAEFSDWADEELKQIRVLPTGTRLEQDATYIDLNDRERGEFTALGNMEAGPEHCYVAKDSVPYQIWNKLRGITDPRRTGAASQEGRTFTGDEV